MKSVPFPLLLIQERQLSVTGKMHGNLVLVNHLGGLSLPRDRVVKLTDSSDMTIAVTMDIKQQQ